MRLQKCKHIDIVSVMQANAQTQAIEHYIDAYNAFDVDGMLKHLSPAVRFENWSGAQLTAEASGIDEFRLLAQQAATLFAEREQRVTAFRQTADSVVASIAYRGRLAVDLPDGPSAGTVLELRGESEFGFENGRISRIVDRS